MHERAVTALPAKVVPRRPTRKILEQVRAAVGRQVELSDASSSREILSLQRAVGNQVTNSVVRVQRNKKTAATVASQVKKNGGAAPTGYEGGRVFQNREGVLPAKDANNKPLQYWEYDVYPLSDRNRGAVRVVIDSNWKAWYTNDHYKTFTALTYT